MMWVLKIIFFALTFTTYRCNGNVYASPSLKSAKAKLFHEQQRGLIRNPRSLNVAKQTHRANDKFTQKRHEHSKMSLISLINSIIGDLCPHGMLPLAYGFAKGGPSGLIPSVVMTIFFGIASAYTMFLYAKLGLTTNAENIGDIWATLMSPQTRWIVDSSFLALCVGCCIFYSSFLGDLIEAMVATFNIDKSPFGNLLSKRYFALVSITLSVLVPLCLLEDLSALQISSQLGVAAIMYTVLFHFKRSFDGSYSVDTGNMLEHMSANMRPKWNKGPERKFNLVRIFLLVNVCLFEVFLNLF